MVHKLFDNGKITLITVNLISYRYRYVFYTHKKTGTLAPISPPLPQKKTGMPRVSYLFPYAVL